MGVMLYSTGCADYDEDIRDLNNRIDQLVSGEIQPLKADLVKVKSDLEAAIAAAQAELKNIHEVDIANLKSADEALDAKIGVANDKILDLEEALNEEVEALEADIAALNTAIEAAKQAAKDADAALKEELVKQIADLNTELSTKLATLETKLNGDIAKLREDAEKAIADANAAIDAVEARADALEAADKDFAEELKAIKADIKAIQEDLAAKYDELTKAVANLKDQVSENTKDIAALEENLSKLSETVEGINTTLADHLVAYAQFQATVEGKIATIESDIEAIEGTIESIEGTIEDLQEQISDNDADIEDIYEAIAVLVQADIDMKNLHENLVADIEEYRASLEAELKAAFGDVYDKISDLTDAHNKLVRDTKANFTAAAIVMEQLADALEAEAINRTARDNQLSAQLEALATELDAQVDAINIRVDAIEEAYKAADEQLQANLDAAVETLNDAIADAIDESKAYTDEEIANLKAQLTDQHKKDITDVVEMVNNYRNELVGEIEKVREEMDAMYADLNKAINCLNKQVADIKDQIDAILNRVQSVVYVPEYSDGKATIEWATIAGTVFEGTSSIEYQVYPADCAVALAEAWNNAEVDNKSFLTFDWKGVAVRSEETTFEIVAVEGSEDGILSIDFEARGLADEFYTDGGAGSQGYSISLVIANETATLSSCYTNVIANTKYDSFQPALYNIIDGAPVVLNGLESITIPYTDKSAYDLLKDVDVRYYDLNNEAYYTWYEVADMGYEVERPEFKFNGIASGIDEAAAAYFNYYLKLTNGKVDVSLPGAFPEDQWLWELIGDGIQAGPDFKFIPVVNLTEEATSESVGSMLAATISYLASGKELSTVAQVIIGKAIGEADATVADIVWTFDEDVDVDAAIYAAASDEVPAYNRTALAVTIDEETAQLHDFTGKYSEFIDPSVTATVVEVAEDGTETEVDGVTATLAADAEEKVSLDINGFAWDKNYKLTFVYELDAIDITVEVLVNTIDRSRETIVINGSSDIKFRPNKPNISETKESNEEFGIVPLSLDGLYDMIIASNADAAVVYPSKEDFYESIFDDNSFTNEDKVQVNNLIYGWGYQDKENYSPGAIKGTYKFVSRFMGNTFLVVNDADRTAYIRHKATAYSYNVEKVHFNQTFYTWYGQEVVLDYVLTFTVPTNYDFVHSDAFVFSDNGYYSNVKGRYGTYITGEGNVVDTYTRALLNFSVYEVDMDAAFRVVELDETTGEIVKYLTAEDLEALSMEATFDFVEEPKDANIVFNGNKLNYRGTDKSVRVAGKLTMMGDVELPTSFDEGKTYAEYKVNQFNPLCDLSINPDAPQYIEVTESQVYTVYAIDYFDLFESREGNGTPYVWEDGFKVNLIDHSTGDWLKGNGTNGWYKNMSRTSIYELTSEFKMTSEIPAEYAQYFSWNETAGELTFNASNQLAMANPIKVTIQMSVDLPWAELKPAEVTITFGPKAGAVTPDVPVEE